MSDENKNIENKQEENQNRQECNKSWWKKFCGLKLTSVQQNKIFVKVQNKGKKQKIFIIILVIFSTFLIVNNLYVSEMIRFKKIFSTNKTNINDNNIYIVGNDKYLVLNDSNKIENKYYNNFNYFSEYEEKIKNRTIVKWKYKEIKNNWFNKFFEQYDVNNNSNNISKYREVFCEPQGVKINAEKIFIYEKNHDPMLISIQKSVLLSNFDIKTIKYEFLRNSDNIGELGTLNLKRGNNIIFFNHDNTILFDSEKKSFKKVSNGIPELKDKKTILLDYSDNLVYIATLNVIDYKKGNLNKTCVEKNEQKNFFIFDSLIKFDLETYKYEKKDIKNSPKIAGYNAFSNTEFLFIGYEDTNMYLYDVIKNEFKLINIGLKNEEEIIIAKYNSKNFLLIPYNSYYEKVVSNKSLYIINRDNFQKTEVENIFPIVNTTSSVVAVVDNKVIFVNGIVFDGNTKKLYRPSFINMKNKDYSSFIIAINDKDFLRLGFTPIGLCLKAERQNINIISLKD